jgi:hypothetical protein
MYEQTEMSLLFETSEAKHPKKLARTRLRSL